jgi:hypothetical protein
VEAELFATNFVYHRHDPAKVDRIVACFAMENNIAGVPVLAANDLREYDPGPLRSEPSTAPLSKDERTVLEIIMMCGGMEVSALAQQGFQGSLLRFQRVPPDKVRALRGKRLGDSIFQSVTKRTQAYIRRFHPILLGAGLSERLCRALDGLESKGWTALRPLAFIFALHDGTLVDHEGWVPTEVYATPEAHNLYTVGAFGGSRRPRAPTNETKK